MISKLLRMPVLLATLVLMGAAKPVTPEQKLLAAAEVGNVVQLKHLPAKTDWNTANAAGETALIHAVARNQTEFIKALLKKKPRLDQPDKAGNTALFYAVSNNDETITKVLLEAGASLKLTNGDKKENILFEAARLGSKKTVTDLLARDSSLLNAVNTDGQTPLFQAIEGGQDELAILLIERGANLKQVTKAGQDLQAFAKANHVKESSDLYKKIKDSK